MTIEAAPPTSIFEAHDDPINQISFAPDKTVMATADTRMRLRIWKDGAVLSDFDLRSMLDKVRSTERVRGIRFSSNSQRVIVAAGEWLNAYDLGGPEEPAWSFIAPRLFAFLIVSPTSLAVSNQDVVAAAFDNGTILFFDIDGNKTSQIRHNAAPRSIGFLPDGRVVGTDSFSVSLWDSGQRKPVWHRQSRGRIYGMAVSGDGELMAVRRLFTVLVLKTQSGEEVATYKVGRGLPLVTFSPSQPLLALGRQHGIDLYNFADAGAGRTLALEDAELISLAFSADGGAVAAGCSDGTVRTWGLGSVDAKLRAG